MNLSDPGILNFKALGPRRRGSDIRALARAHLELGQANASVRR